MAAIGLGSFGLNPISAALNATESFLLTREDQK